MPEYRFEFNDSFLIEAFKKYRKQNNARYAFIVIKSILWLLLLALAILSSWKMNWLLGVLFVALTILMFTGHLLDYWMIKRSFRKSPYRNDNISINVTDDGIHTIGKHSDTKVSWTAFTMARGFVDGVLLFQGPKVFNWLPDTALSVGTRAELEEVIHAHISNYKSID